MIKSLQRKILLRVAEAVGADAAMIAVQFYRCSIMLLSILRTREPRSSVRVQFDYFSCHFEVALRTQNPEKLLKNYTVFNFCPLTVTCFQLIAGVAERETCVTSANLSTAIGILNDQITFSLSTAALIKELISYYVN